MALPPAIWELCVGVRHRWHCWQATTDNTNLCTAAGAMPNVEAEASDMDTDQSETAEEDSSSDAEQGRRRAAVDAPLQPDPTQRLPTGTNIFSITMSAPGAKWQQHLYLVHCCIIHNHTILLPGIHVWVLCIAGKVS